MKNILVDDHVYSISDKQYLEIEKLRIINENEDYFDQVKKEHDYVRSIINNKKPKMFITIDYGYDLNEQ